MPALYLLQRLDKIRGVTRTVSCGLAIVGSLLLSSCGGNNDNKDNNGNNTDRPPSQSPPPAGGGSTIRGGERLVWDQVSASITQVRSLTFRLYVDGRASAFSSTVCNDAGRGTSFECSGLLPAMFSGQHTLELTSVQDGVESDRSPPLLVTVVGGAPPPPAPSPPRDILSPERSGRGNSPVCSDEPRTDCYGVQSIASDLGAVTAISPMPDGRVMFIEAGRQVRIASATADVSAIALSAADNRQLTGLAIDTQFEKSRSVFVAWTELSRGGPVVNITRYRELGNVLGEPATIVTGLPVASGSSTPLAVDNDGLIYVAVPANRSTSGVVMRFDRDGRVPSSNRNASPIVATGYASPLALAVDRSTRTVWLTGRGAREFGEVAVLGIPALSRGTWPSQPSAVERPLNGGTQVESIAIDETPSARDTGVQVVIATEGGLRSVFLEHGAVTRSSDLGLGNGYFANAVAIDRDGALYVGATSPDGAISLLKLTRVSP